MSGPDDAIPLARAPVTAVMARWMMVEACDGECLFGFAAEHPGTGGLSYVLSTHVVELTEAADRARTASGRVYALGREISVRELDAEGRVALRVLLANGSDGYPGVDDDLAWVSARKMARHLRVSPPSRANPAAVQRFIDRHINAYRARRGE
jgi:hypothetical protein